MNEAELAKIIFRKAAPGIAETQTAFCEKWALGTGATLGLIVSQIGDLKDHVSFGVIVLFALIIAASLICYMLAHYLSGTIKVLGQIQPEQEALIKGLGQSGALDDFDLKKFKAESLNLSVPPVTWFVRMLTGFYEGRDTDWIIIKNAHVVSACMIFQVTLSLAALFLLVFNLKI